MGWWNRYWYGPVAAVRPYVVRNGILLLLAFDVWSQSLRTAARYGSGAFNIAHFAWLDAVQPLPSAAVRVGALLATGVLAMMVVCGASRLLLAAVLVTHTYGWSMSMLDSFQHHYFLSLALVCLMFFPAIGVRDLVASVPETLDASGARQSPHTSAWAYVLLCVTVAITYAFAAIPKMDHEWRVGRTFRSIAGTKVLDPLAAYAAELGISQGWFWQVVASSVIVLELALAVGYGVAVRQDGMRRRWAVAIGAGAWITAMSLHVGAEVIQLRIGWFSYYMIVIACGCLLPERCLTRVVSAVTWPARHWMSAMARWQNAAGAGTRSAATVLLTLAAALLLGLVGTRLDLPGAKGVCVATGAVLCAGAFIASRWRGHVAAQQSAIAAAVAAAVMWGAIAQSSVRYDYYRYLAHDLSTRNELEPALAAYLKAERYAPPGESRRDQIEKLRKKIQQAE
jgi:hypothetical protein